MRSVDEVRANRTVRVTADKGALKVRIHRKVLGALKAAGYAGGQAGKEGKIIERTDGENARQRRGRHVLLPVGRSGGGARTAT